MSGVPVEGTCVERLHNHVGLCYRRGLADGFAQGQALGRDTGYYNPSADKRVEAVIDLWVAAILTAAREQYSQPTMDAQTTAQKAMYDLAKALIADGAQQ